MKCPNCNRFLVSPPMLDKACPYCKVKIYVRVEPNTNEKRLLTKEQAGMFDHGIEREYKKTNQSPRDTAG